ncbi:unnamed protein product [Tenebrio molitor]|nr:unnamed protein product [Tenebrio molitor]
MLCTATNVYTTNNKFHFICSAFCNHNQPVWQKILANDHLIHESARS